MAQQEEQAGPSSPPRSGNGDGGGVKLFLGGLSWETSESNIRRHFERFGEIQEVVIMRDTVTKKPRGFGFITFAQAETADAVCAEQHTIDGRQIDAKRSVPQEQKPKSKKIFVGGLAPETMEGQFREYFEQFGKIADAQIMQDHLSGRSRGFGFVTFEEESSVEKVFSSGTMHEISGKKVEVKNATPRGSGPVGRLNTPGRGMGRGDMPGRGGGFGGEVDPSQAYSIPYGIPGYHPGMMGYQYGYQTPYSYNMFMGGFPYAFAQQYHPGYPQMQQTGSAAFDPRQHQMYMAQQHAQQQAQAHSMPSPTRPQIQQQPPQSRPQR